MRRARPARAHGSSTCAPHWLHRAHSRRSAAFVCSRHLLLQICHSNGAPNAVVTVLKPNKIQVIIPGVTSKEQICEPASGGGGTGSLPLPATARECSHCRACSAALYAGRCLRRSSLLGLLSATSCRPSSTPRCRRAAPILTAFEDLPLGMEIRSAISMSGSMGHQDLNDTLLAAGVALAIVWGCLVLRYGVAGLLGLYLCIVYIW